MLDGGADIRFIQQMLGHVSLRTTEKYTHVSIRQLQKVYEATHPGANLTNAGQTDECRDECRTDESDPKASAPDCLCHILAG